MDSNNNIISNKLFVNDKGFYFMSIHIITGGIGSGKSLSIVKEIITRNQVCFTNFHVRHKLAIRLKYEHLFKLDDKGNIQSVNFEFWKKVKEKYGGFDIYLDEFHNVMNSRRSMSKKNVIISDWLAQIRKVLGDSEKNNLYLISQKLRRIDVNCKDLSHKAITCIKKTFSNKVLTTVYEEGKKINKMLPLTMIYKFHFKDADAMSAYESYGIDTCENVTRFIGNKFYRYYDSYEMIAFCDEKEYV